MGHQKILHNGMIVESAAKTLVINEKNEVLVLTIGEYIGHPEKSYTPDLPGGQIEITDGETELVGAIREAEEEAGIVLDPKDMYLAYTKTGLAHRARKSMSFFMYIAHLDYTPDVVISWEHASYEWVPLDELLDKKTFDRFYQEAIEYVLKNRLV